MKVSKEVRIGIYVVLIIAAMYWTVNFLKGRNIFGKENTFYAITSNVQGLRPTSSVYYKGLKIGRVESIKMREDQTDFVIKIRIDKDYNFPTDSRAMIYSADIMGTKALKIVAGTSKTMLTNGESIESGTESDITNVIANELMPIKEKADTLLIQLNKTFDNVNKMLDDKTVADIKTSMNNLSKTLGNLNSASASLSQILNSQKNSINGILENAHTISQTLKDNTQNINLAISNIVSASDKVNKMELDKLAASVQKLLNDINSGNGSLGLLIKDKSLYEEITKTADNLKQLLADIKEHPRRYINVSVFGKKSKE